jgi:hypothetical protein
MRGSLFLTIVVLSESLEVDLHADSLDRKDITLSIAASRNEGLYTQI